MAQSKVEQNYFVQQVFAIIPLEKHYNATKWKYYSEIFKCFLNDFYIISFLWI